MKGKGILAAALLLSGAGANAADVADWSGFYAGGVLGATTFKTETADYWCWYACDAPGNVDTGATFGATGGYNWQDENLVTGVELDVSSGVASEEEIRWNSGSDGVDWDSEWKSMATLRGRVGLAVNKTLVYVTGGLAVVDADFEADERNGTDYAQADGTLTGFVGGVGVEHQFGDDLSFKLEYISVAVEKEDACWADTTGCSDSGGDNDDSVHWTTSATAIRGGVNYRF